MNAKTQDKAASTHQAKPMKLRSGEVLGRNGEVLSRRRNYSDDQFEIPHHLKEAGWSYQWNRMSCRGQVDGPEISRMLDNGWRFVPPDRFGGLYATQDAEYIERDGLVLMERPQTLTDEALSEAQRAAEAEYMKQFQKADTDMALPEGYKAERRRIRKEAREKVDPSLRPHYGAAVIPGDDE
jgi:hypothetical protein